MTISPHAPASYSHLQGQGSAAVFRRVNFDFVPQNNKGGSLNIGTLALVVLGPSLGGLGGWGWKGVWGGGLTAGEADKTPLLQSPLWDPPLPLKWLSGK